MQKNILLWLFGLACIAAPCHAEQPDCSLQVLALQDDGSPAPAGLSVVVVSGEQRFSGTIEDGVSAVQFPELPCGDVSVGLYSGGGAPWHTELGRARLGKHASGHVTLFTHPLGRIDVTVLDREGRPTDRAGAQVMALAATGAPSAGNVLPIHVDKGRTRYVVRQGAYRLSLMPRSWFVSAKIDGKPVRWPMSVEVATKPVQASFTIERQLILLGRVEDAEGKALSDVTVLAYRPGPLPQNYRRIGQVFVDADGSFELAVPRLPVEVVVTDEDRVFEPTHRLAKSYEEPLLFVGHPIRTDLRLEGRVVDQQSGEPLAATRVTLFTQCHETNLPAAEHYRSFMQATAVADSEGRFSLPCSNSCPMQLRFQPGRRGHVRTRVQVPTGQCDSLEAVELPRASVVSINVRDAAGAPLPALRFGGLATNGTTNGKGRLEIPWLGVGTYPIRIDHPFDSADRMDLVLVSDIATATHGREAVIVIENPGDHVQLNLTAVPGGVLCLEAVDAQGNEMPIAGIEVRHDNGIPVAAATFSLSPRNKKDRGRLCTRPLQAGDYRVQVRGPGFIRSWWPGERAAADAMTVHIDAGQTMTLGQMVVEPAGSLDAVLPGWVGEGQQELVWEIQPAQVPDQPLPGDDAPSDENGGPAGWSPHSPGTARCRTRPGWFVHPGPGGLGTLQAINCRLTDLVIGAWHVRAYRPDSDPASSAWRSVEPATVRRGGVTRVVLEPPVGAGTD